LWENLNTIKKIKTDVRDVAITTRNGVRISCYGVTHIDPLQDQLFQALANRSSANDIYAIWGPHPDWLGGSVFSVGRAIRGDYDDFLGIMSIDVDTELLDNICRDIRLGKTGYVMLVDENDQIIYHPQTSMIGKSASTILGKPSGQKWQTGIPFAGFSRGNQVITVKTFDQAKWRIIGISNKRELMQEMNKVTWITLLLILGSILMIIGFAVFLARLLTRPIMELRQSMRLAEEDLNTNVTVRSNDEIGQLGEAFNQMLARIRLLMEQSVQEQKKLRRTEMIALQEQIKPHFIYNTLEMIVGLLETEKNEEVITMVEALGAFFRISLSQGQEYITIREETEHIRNYLYIQKSRHGD
jgi:two-component system sensor histidine kinase YesM